MRLTQLSVVSANSIRRLCSSSPVPPGFWNCSTSWRVRSYWSLETIGRMHNRYLFIVSASSGTGTFGSGLRTRKLMLLFFLLFLQTVKRQELRSKTRDLFVLARNMWHRKCRGAKYGTGNAEEENVWNTVHPVFQRQRNNAWFLLTTSTYFSVYTSTIVLSNYPGCCIRHFLIILQRSSQINNNNCFYYYCYYYHHHHHHHHHHYTLSKMTVS